MPKAHLCNLLLWGQEGINGGASGVHAAELTVMGLDEKIQDLKSLNLALPLIACVMLSKPFYLCEPQFLRL